MKHRISLFCVVFLLLTLCACGTEENITGDNQTDEDVIEDNQIEENETGENVVEENETDVLPEPAEPIIRTIDRTVVSAFYADSDKEAEPLGLSLISESENNISNPEDWVAENNLYLPMINGTLAETATQIYKEPGIDYDYWKQYTQNAVFFDENYIYEWSPDNVCIYDAETAQSLYDVEILSESWYIMGNCAYVRDGILYTVNIFNGYAMPDSCYLIAYDIENGKILWRSDDQTYNSMNFIVKDDVIICGYGFTAEDDYIYQIDMNTGKIISRTKVAKMPDILVEQDGKLYVHTYSYDYVFEIEENHK